MRVHKFQSDNSLCEQMPGAIYGAHAALASQGQNFVSAFYRSADKSIGRARLSAVQRLFGQRNWLAEWVLFFFFVFRKLLLVHSLTLI
jgi:hypothetical protein